MSVLNLTRVPFTTVVCVRVEVSLKLLHSGAGTPVSVAAALSRAAPDDGVGVFAAAESPGSDGISGLARSDQVTEAEL